jgi:ADP-ribosylglycohydrolase
LEIKWITLHYLCHMPESHTILDIEAIENLLHGIAIGDAFGAGVEFQDRAWIQNHVDFTRFVDVRNTIQVPPDQKDAFTKDYYPWDYTDDTEMTIALIKALMAQGPFSETVLLRNLESEYLQGMREKGYGRNGHGSLRWYFEGTKSISEIHAFQRDRPNPGNAPAVRAVPIGLLPATWISPYASINANATHPNPVAIWASQCVAHATAFMLMRQGDAQDIFKYCVANIAATTDFKNYLHLVDHLPAFEALFEADFEVLCGPQPIVAPYFLPGICGVPSDSRYTTGCILYVLKHSKSAFEALKMAIRIGGDVDSIAAVTTGIMAARHGIESIPQFMSTQVEGKNYITEIARLFHEFLSKLPQ